MDKTVPMGAGICPSCETGGPAGEPCSNEVCARRGYHYVPSDYYSGTAGHPDPLIGRRLDDYLLVRRIGRGGFGSVYLGLQMPIQLKCAVKVLHESLDGRPDADALLSRFRGEAEALARLNHPNIVRLLRFGEVGGRPYIVMEFVDGRPLRDEMARARAEGTPLSRKVVDHLLVQALHGLEGAHQLGIVHRDIKPENILIQQVVGNPWYVRIVDFGLAKFLAHGSQTSVLSGTPVYMAPEQLRGQGIGPPCDVYALGVMTYELLTNRPLFEESSSDAVLAHKLDRSYDILAHADGTGLSPAERNFLARALAHLPSQRFPTAGATH